jgi:hypothetical protein
MFAQAVRELSRRRVFRGGAIYVFAAWAALRFVDGLSQPHDPVRRLALLWAIGLFPFAILFSWAFQVTPGHIHREHFGASPPPRTLLGRTIDLIAIVGLVAIVVAETARVILVQH